MPAGPFIIPHLARLNIANATALLGANPANFRLALVSSAWTPNDASDELWSAASGAELANGNGYTTGGIALTGVSLTQSGGTVKFTSNPAVWTASGSGIPAWRRAVLYYSGTLNGKVNPLVAHSLGDATNVDIPLTTAGNNITITPHTNGIVTLAAAA